MDRRNSIEKIDRKTLAPWEIYESTSKFRDHSMYLHVFPEDVENEILPYRIQEEHVQISLEDDSVRRDLNLLLSVAVGEDHFSSERAVVELIRRVGMYLAFEGRAYFEVVTITKKEHLGGSPIYSPLPISGKIIKLGNVFAQIAFNKEKKMRIIFLRPSDVWQIKLPDALGNLRQQRIMRNHLILASKLVPDYLSDMTTNWLEDKNYNAIEFHNIQTNLLASSTRKWGWPARGRWSEKSLDYFMVYRRIWFAHSLAILRSHIVMSLQNLLNRINIPCKIEVNGLMDTQDFIKLDRDLHEGKISFEHALEMTR